MELPEPKGRKRSSHKFLSTAISTDAHALTQAYRWSGNSPMSISRWRRLKPHASPVKRTTWFCRQGRTEARQGCHLTSPRTLREPEDVTSDLAFHSLNHPITVRREPEKPLATGLVLTRSGCSFSVKLSDIRSLPANLSDSIFCATNMF